MFEDEREDAKNCDTDTKIKQELQNISNTKIL